MNERLEPAESQLSVDDWLAFVLSLALPGAGQLWKGNASGLLWLATAGMLVAVWGLLAENLDIRWPVAQYGSFIVVCLCSAWHACRCRGRSF